MRLARCAYEVASGTARLGSGELWLRDRVVVHHDLRLGASPLTETDMSEAVRRTHPPTGGATSPLRIFAEEVSQECSGFVTDVCTRFAAHLVGTPVTYDDVELDLDGLTPLSVAFTRALRAVPWGEVVTYGELASLAGRPGAARAAGTFCADCPWSLIVPCHRVVAAGGIGGYGATGVETKRRLLRLEGVDL